MKYEINYGRDFGGRIGDRWFWRTIEADDKETAIKKIFQEHKANYIVSIASVIETS